MPDCELIIRGVLGAIEPSAARKAAAARSHNYLRDLLSQGRFGSRILGSYLSGSYARSTAIHPLDDVDVIMLVDPNGWPIPFLSSLPDPGTILDSFQGAIKRRYPNSSVHRQRRSVCLVMNHLNIDVVPAVEGDEEGVIWIPDRDADHWIQSSPRCHARCATEINARTEGRFIPLVKLLKQWNGNLPASARLKSFTIETAAVRLFQREPLPSLQMGLQFFFDFFTALGGGESEFEWESNCGMRWNWLGARVPDVADTGGETAGWVDGDRQVRFHAHAARSRARMLRLQNARESTRIRVLEKMFGVRFGAG